MFRFRMWAVKNSQKRRSACLEGEKSAGVAVWRAGGVAHAELSTGPGRGTWTGLYADYGVT